MAKKNHKSLQGGDQGLGQIDGKYILGRTEVATHPERTKCALFCQLAIAQFRYSG